LQSALTTEFGILVTPDKLSMKAIMELTDPVVLIEISKSQFAGFPVFPIPRTTIIFRTTHNHLNIRKQNVHIYTKNMKSHLCRIADDPYPNM